MTSRELPKIRARHSRFGLMEAYEYPPGPADAMPVHAHREMQLCFSVDFPGRYFYRDNMHDVPVGAVSILDAWEPHAASDPIDRNRLSHYLMLYVDPAAFRESVDLPRATSAGSPIRRDASVVSSFLRLYRALRSNESDLQQDELLRECASAVLAAEPSMKDPPSRSLLRARDFIAANAGKRIGLADIAAQADLSPWHFARAFRRRFGVPPHQFQTWMRIDLSRRLLTDGVRSRDVALSTGFADQSHFIRSFKRLVGTTPAHYQRVSNSREGTVSGEQRPGQSDQLR
jgi:AraC-like DNA-binding protein